MFVPWEIGSAAMKKILFILIGLVVLGGVGGGGYKAWMGSWEDGTGLGQANSFSTVKEIPAYIELQPVTAPFRRGDKNVQYLVLSINLEVRDKDLVDSVRERMPRLLDTYTSELYALAGERGPEQRSINLARVQARLLTGSDRVLGPGVIRAVLVQLAR